MYKIVDKTSLNRRIADCFDDDRIRDKSSYIRHNIVNKYVDDSLVLVNREDYITSKHILEAIDNRQVRGYSSFETMNKSLDSIADEVDNLRTSVAVLGGLTIINIVISFIV